MKTLINFNSPMKVKYIFGLLLLLTIMLSNGIVLAATRTAKASTAWNLTSTWNEGAVPTSADDVTIGASFTVSLTADADCKTLTLQGTSGTRLTINNYTLSVSSSLAGPNGAFSNNIITTGTGRLKFIGNSAGRILFTANWSNAYTTGWRCEVALNTGATGTSNANVKFSDLIVTSGTFVVGSTSATKELRIDGGSEGTGTVSIASKAYLTVTGFMGARTSTPTTYCGTVTIDGTLTIQGNRLNGTITVNNGGVLVIKRISNASDLASNPTNNFIYAGSSTLQYDLEGSVSTMPTGAEISQAQSASLYNLTINNSNSINLKSSFTINGTLKIIAGSITTSLSPVISYGSTGELYYQGASAQTTSDLVFPSSNGPFNLTIDNAAGVTLHASRTINGTVTVKTGAALNAQDFTVSGSGSFNLQPNSTLITAHTSGINGTNATSGSSVYDNSASYVFNAPSLAQVTGSKLPTTVNNLTVDGRSQLSLTNSALTVNGTLHVKAESSFDAKGVAIGGGGDIFVEDGATTTFITAHPNGLDGTNATTGGGSYFGISNYTFNYGAAQITGNWLPATINNLTVDNSTTLTLSNTVACNDVTVNGSSSHLIVPPGIGLTANGVATFDSPLQLKASTTAFRSIMGTFINNPSNGVMGRISSDFRYTTNGFNGQKTGRSYYFSPSTYEVTSGLFNPEATLGDGNNPFSYYDLTRTAPKPGWNRIWDGVTPLNVMNAYGIRSLNSQTFTLTGFPNDQSSYSVSLPCPSAANNLYYMVGNPYPAVVDWEQVTLPSDIDVTIYYRTSDASGNMCTETYQQGGVGSNNIVTVDGRIPPMQAFFVRATGSSGSATLTIPAGARGHDWGGTQVFYKSKPKLSAKTKVTTSVDRDIFSLYMYTKNRRDQMIIVQADYANDADDKWDAFKMFTADDDTSRAALYTFTPNLNKVIIQSVKPVTSEKIFSIGLFNTFPGKSFKFEADFSKTSKKYNYFIEDTVSMVTQDLNQNPAYTFTSNVLKDNINNYTRFRLHVLLAPKVNITNSASSCSSQTVDLTAASITQGSDNGLTFTYWLDSKATIPYSTPESAGAGTYYIKGTAANGSYTISEPVVLTNSTPTLVTNSPNAVCSPSTVDITKPEITTGSTNGLTYSYWTDSNATLSYSTPTSSTSGTYFIKGTDNYGCYTISNPVQVTIKPSPTLVTISPSPVCSPITIDLTTPEITSGSSSGLTYSYWTNSNATISYSTPNSAINGVYYIKGAAPNGCYAISEPIVVTINNQPTVTTTNPPSVISPATVDLTSPEITLGSTSGLDYTYWLDATATNPYNTPQMAIAGDYYIKGTVSITGCYSIAGPVTVTIDPSSGVDPNTENITIIYSYDSQIHINNCLPNSTITIYDVLGRLNYSGLASSTSETINSNFRTGVYIVKVQSAQNIKTQKIFIR